MESFSDKKYSEEIDLDLKNSLLTLLKKNDYKSYLDLLNENLLKVEIIENHEPLLDIKENLDKRIYVDLVDLKIGKINENGRFYLRKTIIDKLNRAQDLLPDNICLKIRDAFRSEELVWKLFALYKNRLKELKPNLSERELDLEIRMFLAMPDDLVPPGHMTGGAIDVILCDKNGINLEMEVDYSLVKREYQIKSYYSDLPEYVMKNRILLLDVMESVGFQNYAGEYWHFSYGDPYWAVRQKNKKAFYGIPKDFK